MALYKEIHGLTANQLDKLTISGNKVYWATLGGLGTTHRASCNGVRGWGTTRHAALNALLKKLHREEPVAKSRDRVKFKVLEYYFRVPEFANVLSRAFSITANELLELKNTARTYGEAVVICRPSQFARFLIYHAEAGFQNMFKELEAELFTPEPPKPQLIPVDVSSH